MISIIGSVLLILYLKAGQYFFEFKANYVIFWYFILYHITNSNIFQIWIELDLQISKKKAEFWKESSSQHAVPLYYVEREERSLNTRFLDGSLRLFY